MNIHNLLLLTKLLLNTSFSTKCLMYYEVLTHQTTYGKLTNPNSSDSNQVVENKRSLIMSVCWILTYEHIFFQRPTVHETFQETLQFKYIGLFQYLKLSR